MVGRGQIYGLFQAFYAWRCPVPSQLPFLFISTGQARLSPRRLQTILSFSHWPISDFWNRFDSKTSVSVSVYQESREQTDPISCQQLKQQWEEKCGKKGRKEEENRAGPRVPPSALMATLQDDAPPVTLTRNRWKKVLLQV